MTCAPGRSSLSGHRRQRPAGGAAQPMARRAGDVMRLLRLLLAAGPPILPREPLPLGGEPEGAGEAGQPAERPHPSLQSPERPPEGTKGRTGPPAPPGQAEQSRSGPEDRPENTGTRGQHTVRRTPCTAPGGDRGRVRVRGQDNTLLHPSSLCLTCRGTGCLLPGCCPGLPHPLRWALCGRQGQAGRAVGQSQTPLRLLCGAWPPGAVGLTGGGGSQCL